MPLTGHPQFQAADGRKGYPTVMSYRDKDSRDLFSVPPLSGRPYFLEIYDKTAYDHLAGTGWVYGDEHRGASKGIIDARRATL